MKNIYQSKELIQITTVNKDHCVLHQLKEKLVKITSELIN